MDANDVATLRARWNRTRHVSGAARGGYESWFCRANHPSRPLAFWIRYTIFSPRGHADAAVGELWCVWFDGEKGRTVAVKEEHRLEDCRFAPDGLDTRIADARLDATSLEGRAASSGHTVAWSLAYASPGAPLLLLPEGMYEGAFPKAKALVPAPHARFDGHLVIDGTRESIEGWMGSQNHNWGSEHTARYAWGQVAGFEDAPDAFLEVSTARVRVGPVLTPPMTVLVLRLGDEELRLSSVPTALRARARYEIGERERFEWSFASRARGVSIEGSVSAPRTSFVALPYDNPPGGVKTCLNSKLARCTLRVTRPGRAVLTLTTETRAAFEILGDEAAPIGVARLDR